MRKFRQVLWSVGSGYNDGEYSKTFPTAYLPRPILSHAFPLQGYPFGHTEPFNCIGVKRAIGLAEQQSKHPLLNTRKHDAGNRDRLIVPHNGDYHAQYGVLAPLVTVLMYTSFRRPMVWCMALLGIRCKTPMASEFSVRCFRKVTGGLENSSEYAISSSNRLRTRELGPSSVFRGSAQVASEHSAGVGPTTLGRPRWNVPVVEGP